MMRGRPDSGDLRIDTDQKKTISQKKRRYLTIIHVDMNQSVNYCWTVWHEAKIETTGLIDTEKLQLRVQVNRVN